VALLAGEGLLRLLDLFQNPHRRAVVLFLMLLTLVLNAGYYKFRINTGIWSYGVYWRSDNEMRGYLWLRRHLPVNTKVFTFLDNSLVIGHDMLAKTWTTRYKNAFHDSIDLPPDELYRRLRRLGFAYIIVGQREVRHFGLKKINAVLTAFDKDPHFVLVYKVGDGARVFKIVNDGT
jgi:hypothetical protein